MAIVNRSSPAGIATSLYTEFYASRPVLGASAPGRVNLIGEHTDYNGGPVLPLALARRTAVMAGPHHAWQVVSAMEGVVHRVDPDAPAGGGWTAYARGVIRVLRRMGVAPPGARLAIASNVPIGAGLSSSAALTVSLAKALVLLAQRRIPPAQLADIAYRAEHDEVGVMCGRMDQTIAALATPGSALLFETGSGSIDRVPAPGKVWVLETGLSHRLSGGALNVRRRECEKALALCRARWPRLRYLAELEPSDLPTLTGLLVPPLLARVRHVVTETARTRAAATALGATDLPALGRLLVEGHESLRVDYESSCHEADVLVSSAMEHGAHGARLTGAGWGGAVIMLAPKPHEARIVAEIQEDFRRAFGRLPEVWSTRAAGGARREPPAGPRRALRIDQEG